MYSDKISQAQSVIARVRPKLAESRLVYEAILQFYSDSSLIETQIADLEELLKHKKIEAYKTSAKSFKECVNNLLDSYPELAASKGMLRFYETSRFEWQECESAEIAFGKALTLDTYGWQPDSWTVFKKDTGEVSLTAVAAL